MKVKVKSNLKVTFPNIWWKNFKASERSSKIGEKSQVMITFGKSVKNP